MALFNNKTTIPKNKPVSETKLNRFLDEVEKKYLGKNPFKRIISKWKFDRFCKEVMKSSPSLGVLWFFADFIKLAERIYFFNNSKDGELYSSYSYPIGENGFIINDKDHNISINIKLNSDYQKVIVEVKRLFGTYKSTEHCFINNDWTEDRQNYDEVLIDNTIGIINTYIVGLLRYCWKSKGSYDNINKIIS